MKVRSFVNLAAVAALLAVSAMAADVTSVVYFGLLTSLTLSVALLCDILLLPSLLILFSREKAAGEGQAVTAAD